MYIPGIEHFHDIQCATEKLESLITKYQRTRRENDNDPGTYRLEIPTKM